MNALVQRFLGPAAARVLVDSGRLARGQAEASADEAQAQAELRREAIESGRCARPVGRERQLPFDILLGQGGGALRLFRAGPFDELRFFQRVLPAGVSHDTEFLVRLDPRHHGTERFAPFGVARLRADRALPLPGPRDPRGPLAAALRAARLTSIPTAAALLGNRTTAFEPGRADSDGDNRVRSVGPEAAAAVEVLRRQAGPALVGFFEAAFTRAQGDDRVVHRYYLDPTLRAWVVRDHPRDGKRLFAVEASAARETGLLVYVGAPLAA
jgi:hypothetical protein